MSNESENVPIPEETAENAPLTQDSGSVDGQLFPEMDWTTRIQGFVLFTALAFLASTLAWIALGIGFYWKYATLNVLGTIMSMIASCVLMGPMKQLESMFEPQRRSTTVLYLGSLVLTFVVALMTHSAFLTAICTFVQYGACMWYSLSYVPYGQRMVWTFVQTTMEALVGVSL